MAGRQKPGAARRLDRAFRIRALEVTCWPGVERAETPEESPLRQCGHASVGGACSALLTAVVYSPTHLRLAAMPVMRLCNLVSAMRILQRPREWITTVFAAVPKTVSIGATA
jgi:hypothetical protein